MADQLIRAGIVLTGDAAGAVAAFATTKREAENLKQKFNEAQAEVNKLAGELKAFASVGAAPLGVTASFEKAKAAAQALARQVDDVQARLQAGRQSLDQFGISSQNLNEGLRRIDTTVIGNRLTEGLSQAGRLAQDFGAQMAAGLSRAGLAADVTRQKLADLQAVFDAARRKSDIGLRLTEGLSAAGANKTNDWDGISRGMSAAGRAADEAKKKVAELAGQKSALEALGGAAGGVAKQVAALASVGIGVGTVQVAIRTADAYQLVAQRLSLVVERSGDLGRVEQTLFDSAQRTRLAYTDLADSYARIARNAKQSGIEQERLLKINEAIAKASTISGGTPESINGSLIQLSQGIASNRLGGDELRSVLEQNTRLAQAIADGLGVSIGELRQMGEDGQLTAERVLLAIEKSAGRLDAEFSSLQATGGQAWQVLANSAGHYLDVQNEAVQGTRALAAIMIGTAKLLDQAAIGANPGLELARRQAEAERQQLEVARQAGFRDALNQTFALYRSGKIGVDSYRAAVEQLITTQAAVERYARGAEQLPKATQAFLEVQARLSGVNQNFAKDLNTLHDGYTKGVVPLERYRALVAKLIETETEAGKKAKEVADERFKLSRDLVEKSVADQQHLVDATRKAFEESLADAKKFAAEAEKLRVDAATVRQTSQAKADARRGAGSDLTPEEQSARAARNAQDLLDKSSFAASGALAAAFDGRFEVAKRKAEQAKALADEAEKLADKVTSDRRAAEIIEDAGKAQAAALEALAKGQDKAAAGAKTQADAQREILGSLEERAVALRKALEALPVKLDTDPAKAAFEALKEEFGKGFTVPLRTSAANDAPALAVGALSNLGNAPGFAAGGSITGPGPRGRDSVLMWGAPGEFVHRTAAVDFYGVDFMRRVNALQIPRFAVGGLVDRVRVATPAGGGSGGGQTTINLTLPGMGSFPLTAEADVAGALVRAARKLGARG